jgi:hypothetical protein
VFSIEIDYHRESIFCSPTKNSEDKKTFVYNMKTTRQPHRYSPRKVNPEIVEVGPPVLKY